MTTTNLYSGIGEKSSSRVLKPPGGGHSNIFGEPDANPIRPRPKHNQQNSSNLAFVCGTMDANEKVAQAAPVAPEPVAREAPAAQQVTERAGPPANTWDQSAPPPQHVSNDTGKPRVPPGGFSSGFW